MWNWLRRLWRQGMEEYPLPPPKPAPTPALVLPSKRETDVDAVISKADKTLEDARTDLKRWQRELSLMTGRNYDQQ